jgi:HAD superfamily hydrolase (TIGR01509 family)
MSDCSTMTDQPPPPGPTAAGASRTFDLVIFDCDGVLVDSEIISCLTVVRMFERHGVPCDLATVLTRYLGRPASTVTDDFARLARRPLPADFVDSWRAELFESFARDLVPVPGAREAVEALRRSAIDYCLASSGDEERIGVALRKAGLFDFFEGRIFSTTMVERGKPAPDLFLLAAATHGAAPGRCVVVEDSVAGVAAARAAGMTAVAFTAGSHYRVMDQTQPLLDAGASCVAASMPELRLLLARMNAGGVAPVDP